MLLPDRFTSLEPRFQSAIACHELVHVRRHDWAHHLGEEVLRALFWFHPAIAWLISRARVAREQLVDMEVVKLTNARKTYLEALLEFTKSRSSLATIPAPPFLAERQLVERVVLMLKEVRMSRRRLIASLTLISCCLILVLVLVAWTFPLKGAPRPVPPAFRHIAEQSPDSAAPLLHRIEVTHHDFGSTPLNDTVVNEERASLDQLPGRLTLGTAYDQAKADAMTKALEDFWSERGINVEVRTTLTSWPRSADRREPPLRTGILTSSTSRSPKAGARCVDDETAPFVRFFPLNEARKLSHKKTTPERCRLHVRALGGS